MPSLLRSAVLICLAVLACPSPAGAGIPTQPGPQPGPQLNLDPLTSFVGRLWGSPDAQAPEVDLGLITSVRYTFSGANQGIAISSSLNGKNNLCFIQFNSVAMSSKLPGWTRAEPLESYREIVAAARTPNSRILCIAPLSAGNPGSISRVSFNGTMVWVVLGGASGSEFQIIVN